MAGLKFSSFGAATMPLSKIVVDGDLDLRPYNTIAKSIRGYIDPTGWDTTPISWPSDTTPSTIASGDVAPGTNPTLTWSNSGTKAIEVSGEITNTGFQANAGYVYIDGARIYSSPSIAVRATYTFPPMWVNPGETVTLRIGGTAVVTGKVNGTGRLGTPETIDLSNAWIAIDINMMGLTATLSILGTNTPYDDYALYFPLKPDSISISGTMAHTSDRPALRGYL